MDYTKGPSIQNGDHFSVKLTKEEVKEMIDKYGCGGACGYMGCGHELTQIELAQSHAYILYAHEGGAENA